MIGSADQGNAEVSSSENEYLPAFSVIYLDPEPNSFHHEKFRQGRKVDTPAYEKRSYDNLLACPTNLSITDVADKVNSSSKKENLSGTEEEITGYGKLYHKRDWGLTYPTYPPLPIPPHSDQVTTSAAKPTAAFSLELCGEVPSNNLICSPEVNPPTKVVSAKDNKTDGDEWMNFDMYPGVNREKHKLYPYKEDDKRNCWISYPPLPVPPHSDQVTTLAAKPAAAFSLELGGGVTTKNEICSPEVNPPAKVASANDNIKKTNGDNLTSAKLKDTSVAYVNVYGRKLYTAPPNFHYAYDCPKCRRIIYTRTHDSSGRLLVRECQHAYIREQKIAIAEEKLAKKKANEKQIREKREKIEKKKAEYRNSVPKSFVEKISKAIYMTVH